MPVGFGGAFWWGVLMGERGTGHPLKRVPEPRITSPWDKPTPFGYTQTPLGYALWPLSSSKQRANAFHCAGAMPPHFQCLPACSCSRCLPTSDACLPADIIELVLSHGIFVDIYEFCVLPAGKDTFSHSL